MQFILITFLSSFVYFDYIFLLFSYLPITPSFSFFFFFNDTAPPEISPLSLHDALPISAGRPVQAADELQQRGLAVAGGPLDGEQVAVRDDEVDPGQGLDGLLPAPVGDRRGPDRGRRDRKSTRLNSSHQIISHAVFCLKK